jgi:hypothetical protein
MAVMAELRPMIPAVLLVVEVGALVEMVSVVIGIRMAVMVV